MRQRRSRRARRRGHCRRADRARATRDRSRAASPTASHPDPGAVERGFDIRSEKIQLDRTLRQPPRRDQHDQGQRGNDRPAPAQQAVRAAPEMPGRFAMTRRPIRALCAGRRRPLGGARRRSAARSCREPDARCRARPRDRIRAVMLLSCALRRYGRRSEHSAGSRRPPAARAGPVRLGCRARRGGGREIAP